MATGGDCWGSDIPGLVLLDWSVTGGYGLWVMGYGLWVMG